MRLAPLAAVLAASLSLAGCEPTFGPESTPPTPPRAPAAQIYYHRISPDPVAVGDTATVYVAVVDSANVDQLRFDWTSRNGSRAPAWFEPYEGRMDGPRIRIVAPDVGAEPGELWSVSLAVVISDREGEGRGVVYTYGLYVQY